ncbi:MAG: hypothetical protein MO853_05430 [Candidatus Protistobacter heckmanni]|nr:hypothetical protein [Candidatus Protistobacter heckmanni]
MNGRELVAVDACRRYRIVAAQDCGRILGEGARFMPAELALPFGFPEYLAAIRRYLDNRSLLEGLWLRPPERLDLNAWCLAASGLRERHASEPTRRAFPAFAQDTVSTPRRHTEARREMLRKVQRELRQDMTPRFNSADNPPA